MWRSKRGWNITFSDLIDRSEFEEDTTPRLKEGVNTSTSLFRSKLFSILLIVSAVWWSCYTYANEIAELFATNKPESKNILVSQTTDVRRVISAISRVESPKMKYDAYHNAALVSPSKPISQHTLWELYTYDEQVLAATRKENQKRKEYNKTQGKKNQVPLLPYSTAAWIWQILKRYRKSLQKKLWIPDQAKYDEYVQDLMVTYLLVEAGLCEYIQWDLSRKKFHKKIANIRAWVPSNKNWDSAHEWNNGNTAHMWNWYTYDEFSNMLDSIPHWTRTLAYGWNPDTKVSNIFLLDKKTCLSRLKFQYQCSLKWIIIHPSETYRHQERQNHVKAKWYSRTSHSLHTKHKAVDFIYDVKTHWSMYFARLPEQVNDQTVLNPEIVRITAEIAKECWWETWAYRSSLYDPNHIQFSNK